MGAERRERHPRPAHGRAAPAPPRGLADEAGPRDLRPRRDLSLVVEVPPSVDGRNVLMSDYLQCVAGYSLTADVREQCLWFFHGDGQNGKSTFLNTLRELLGG